MNESTPSRIAVLDIGSNTVRMQVSEVREKSYRVIEEFKAIVRIGDEVFSVGHITPDAERRLVTALKEARAIIDRWQVDTLRAVATAAFRDAKNYSNVMKRIIDVIGHPVQIITGDDEARLVHLAASANFQLSKYRAAIIDIGGGSTELCVVKHGRLTKTYSLPLGCNLLTRTFLPGNPPTFDELSTLKSYLRKKIGKLRLKRADICICTGGSMNAVATMAATAAGNSGQGSSPIKYVDRKYLKNFINSIKWMTTSERALIPGMEERRADIILAAAIETDLLLDATGCEGFYALAGGLRQGLTIDTINRMGGQLPFQEELADDVRLSRIVEIGNKFAFEEDHARRVAGLALTMYRGLKSHLDLPGDDSEILEAAAMLHDIGSYISYAKHHRHSAYLIENSDLVGYGPEDVELIAAVAKHHRKRVPRLNYDKTRRIVRDDRYRTAVLAGILRLADALDRSHKGIVSGVSVSVSGDTITVSPETAADDIDMERRDFEYKKGLLEHVSGRRVELS